MLNRSFKAAKCKTALKLATSRLKLMKNKKLVQINQIKRELSQLLEAGQDRTARIRVEHVIREEKMVAAYDLIEIYCELIAARLPIIESQKICPIDLKEAVTSVIYASPRCSDIPELQDARKHFTTKYGKEFISAAIELRPDSGVGRMLIEKLSTVAPDVQTKIKVLSAIAEEYNIKWDPKALEEKESKPHDDLLNGPSTFEKASVMHAAPPMYQAAPPNVHVPYGQEQGRNELFNYSQQNSRSSLGTGSYTSMDTDARASGRDPERLEERQSFPRDENDNSYDRRNWNMEFTDAIDAAQVAAESAERASMAARAAAQLSRQEKRSGQTGQYSNDPGSFREQEPRRYGASDLPTEHYSRGSYNNNSFSDKKPKVQDQLIGRSENGEKSAGRFNEDGYGRRSSQTASLRSRNNSVHDDNSANTEEKVHGYSKESSFNEKFVKVEKGTTSSSVMSNRERTRRESNVELDNRLRDSFISYDYGYHGEVIKINQSSTSSSLSHSLNLNDDVADDVASDESGSDEEGPRFDREPQFDEVDIKSFFPSPDRKSPDRKKMNEQRLDLESPKRGKSSVSPTAYGSDFNYSSFKSTQEERKKSHFDPPPRFFDDDDDDIPKGNSSSKVHLGTRLSQRTKQESLKQEASMPIHEPKISRREESCKSQKIEKTSSGQAYAGPQTHSASSRHDAIKREESLKSQAVEQPSSPQRKRVDSSDPEVKKASHVHPKLPDYDDIAARLQALRMNR